MALTTHVSAARQRAVLKQPFADSVRTLGGRSAFWLSVAAVLIAAFASVPGFASGVIRPIDIIGPLLWGVVLSGSGGRLARMLLLAGVVLVSTAIAMIWLYPQNVVAEQAMLAARYLLVFGSLAAVYVARLSESNGRRLLMVTTVASVASCVTSIIGYRRNMTATFAHQTFSDGTPAGMIHRLGGWVGESGAYGALAVVSSFALAISMARTRFRMLGYAAAMALIMVSYALSLARVCVIGAAILTVCILIAERKRASFWLLFVPAGIAAVWIASTAGVLPEFTPQSLSRLDLGNGNVTSGRTEHWAGILQGSLQSGGWVTGLGVRGAEALFNLPTENFFVSTFADFGVLFGVVYLVIVLRMWLDFSRDARGVEDRPTRIMTRGMLVAVLSLWMFNDITTYFQAFPLFALTLGAVLSTARRDDAADLPAS